MYLMSFRNGNVTCENCTEMRLQKLSHLKTFQENVITLKENHSNIAPESFIRYLFIPTFSALIFWRFHRKYVEFRFSTMKSVELKTIDFIVKKSNSSNFM